MRNTLSTIVLLGLAGVACAGDKTATSFDALDANKDGVLSPAEFAEAKSGRAFETLDRNSDGQLDRREYAEEKPTPDSLENK